MAKKGTDPGDEFVTWLRPTDDASGRQVTRSLKPRHRPSERLTDSSDATTQTTIRASTQAPETSDVDRRYRSKAMLGEGGMGKIHLTKDTRIGRDVAMKVLRKRFSQQPDTVARFLREARVQGQLEHPSIVPVYDLMRKPDGTLCFTMKRVKGKTLEQIVDGLNAKDRSFIEAYPRRKLLRAFSAACLAVDFAHNNGVLHRDLKPSNIMLGDYGEVYVLDWGLSKLMNVPDTVPKRVDPVTLPDDPTTHTIDGAVLGTPGYMAPEQARGETADMDGRSDVYSLGAILYEMLALEPLHQRGTVSCMMNSTMHGTDGRPSFRSPSRSIPSELDAISVKATQLQREHRFTSARELHDAIERYLDGEQDLKLMREMAQAHARAAEVAAEYALAGGSNSDEERVRALREVGRALALDPSHIEAQRVLWKLLQEPPRELPPDEQFSALTDDTEESRLTANLGGYQHLSFIVTTALVLWMGVRSWPAAISYFVLSGLATAIAFYSPKPKHREAARFANVVASTLALGFMSTMFGPLFLIPGLAATTTMAASFVTPTRSARALVIAMGVLAVLVPLFLEFAGVLPPSYLFTDSGLLILPRMHDFPRAGTLAFLCWIGLSQIISISLMMGRLHEARNRALEKLHKQTWQLRKLVTDDASPQPR